MSSSNTLYDLRQESDYEDFFVVDAAKVAAWLEQAFTFINAIESLIKQKAL